MSESWGNHNISTKENLFYVLFGQLLKELISDWMPVRFKGMIASYQLCPMQYRRAAKIIEKCLLVMRASDTLLRDNASKLKLWILSVKHTSYIHYRLARQPV